MSGWGVEAWGLGAWGLGSAALSSVRAVSTHTVLVTLTGALLAKAPYNVGDALNPLSWVITDNVTGYVFTILSVTEINASNYFLNTLEPLGPFQHAHTLDASAVLTSLSAPLSAPTSFTFYGVVAVANANQATTAPLVDMENNGAYRITTGGDYAEQSGGTIVRKIIQRRLATNPGGFFYLTDFGLGMNIKGLVTIPGLIGMKAQIELQIQAEPEVVAATATLSLDTRGFVYGVLRVKLRSGTDVEEIPVTSTVQF